MTLPKLSLLIFLTFSLTACGPRGPLITTCISDPPHSEFRCFNASTHQNVLKTKPQADSFVCLSPVDEKNLLMSCAGKTTGPLVNLCIYDYPTDELVCFNQASKLSNQIPYVKSENYVCVSAHDFQAVVTYCAEKKAGRVP